MPFAAVGTALAAGAATAAGGAIVNAIAGGGSSSGGSASAGSTSTGTSGGTTDQYGNVLSPGVQIGSVAGSPTAAQGYITAGQIQSSADQQAAQLAATYNGANIGNFQPYMAAGSAAANQLQAQLPQLTAAFNPTMAGLEATPGYQFTLNQGLKATQNSATAQGLGVSGTALQAGDAYATGLASQTYNQQFQNYLAQQQAQYNKLVGTSQMGQQAAYQLGSVENPNVLLQAQALQNSGNALGSAASTSADILAGQQNAWGTAFGGIAGQLGGSLGKSISSGINSLLGGGSDNSGGNTYPNGYTITGDYTGDPTASNTLLDPGLYGVSE